MDKIKKFTFEQFWPNPYNLAIIWCTHWNETLWFRIIKKLKSLMINNVTYIVANNIAKDKNIRYIEFDLNRCFINDPSWKGKWTYENELSFELDKFLKQFNYIIDLHSTDFETPWYFIINDLKKINLPIIQSIETIKNVYFLDNLWWTLISNYDNAVAIEIWDNNNENKDIIIIKSILEFINNKKWIKKSVYTWWWEILKKDIKYLKKWIQDFTLIKKWDLFWYDQNWNKKYLNEDNYFLWVNKVDDNILCHTLKKIV
jgi:hypothetical protein